MTREQDLARRVEDLEAQQALLVQALAVACRELGYGVGLQTMWGQADWPHIVIDLPVLGPVAWRIPDAALRLRLPAHSMRWDHSRDPERHHRLSAFLAAKEFAASGHPPAPTHTSTQRSAENKKGRRGRSPHKGPSPASHKEQQTD